MLSEQPRDKGPRVGRSQSPLLPRRRLSSTEPSQPPSPSKALLSTPSWSWFRFLCLSGRGLLKVKERERGGMQKDWPSRPMGPNWGWGFRGGRTKDKAIHGHKLVGTRGAEQGSGQTGSCSWIVEDVCFPLGALSLPPTLLWEVQGEERGCDV